jgi:hypothetical protein
MAEAVPRDYVLGQWMYSELPSGRYSGKTGGEGSAKAIRGGWAFLSSGGGRLGIPRNRN